MREAYISIDVEADGPIPGPYSMLSVGMTLCGTHDGSTFTPHDPDAETFYAELKPISEEYVPESLAVSGLDRDLLGREGREPAEAMDAAARWVKQAAKPALPVAVAFPLGFDWMWLYWYFVKFAGKGSPFGHSRHMDMKTMYAAKAGVPIGKAIKRQMPPGLLSGRPHTHHALDDAIEQAELFQNLMTWQR